MSFIPENNFEIPLPDFEGGFEALLWSWDAVNDDDYILVIDNQDDSNNLSPFSSPDESDSQLNPIFNSTTVFTTANSNSPAADSPTYSVASSVIVSCSSSTGGCSNPSAIISTPHSTAAGNTNHHHDDDNTVTNGHDLITVGYTTTTTSTSPDISSNDNDHNYINDNGSSYNIVVCNVETKSSSDPFNTGLQQTSSQPADESIIDERRQRRMLSNRESARRSRMRKQRHVEKLRVEVNRLKMENREWANRLRFILHHYQLARRDNQRLAAEGLVLHHRLTQLAPLFQVSYTTQLPYTRYLNDMGV